MITRKTTAKASTPKKAAAKKTVAAKAAPKKAPSKPITKTSVRRVRPTKARVQSFKRADESEPFLTFRITNQTLYWLILSLFVLALGMWVVNINDKVQKIYDEIDRVNAAEQSIVMPTKKAE